MWLKISWSFPLTFFHPWFLTNSPDFFSRDFFARNLGKNLFLIKLKIWERNFVVFPLILANDVFEMFQSGIFLKPRCFECFKNKLRSFKEFFCGVGIGIGHFLFQRKFFEFFKEKRGRVEKCHFSRLKLPFFKTYFLCWFWRSSCQEEISGTSSEVRKSSPQITTDRISSDEFCWIWAGGRGILWTFWNFFWCPRNLFLTTTKAPSLKCDRIGCLWVPGTTWRQPKGEQNKRNCFHCFNFKGQDSVITTSHKRPLFQNTKILSVKVTLVPVTSCMRSPVTSVRDHFS